MRDALLNLHNDLKIFGNVRDAQLQRIASDAADNWRILAKHVYDLVQAECDNEDIRELLDLIVLPKVGSSHSSATSLQRAATSQSLGENAASELTFPNFDDAGDVDDIVVLSDSDATTLPLPGR